MQKNMNTNQNAMHRYHINITMSHNYQKSPCIRTLVKSAQQKKTIFYFSTKTYVVGTQKNRLNETVLLSTQNIC